MHQPKLPLPNNKCEALHHKDFMPFLNREEINEVGKPCSNLPINILSCRSPLLREQINAVNGLDFNNIKSQLSLDYIMPNFIPIIDKGAFNVDSGKIPSPIVGVSLEDVIKFSKKSDILKIDQGMLQRNAFKNKKTLLFCTGPNKFIEPIWERLKRGDGFLRLASMGLSAITAFNFSLFQGECPLGQALNLKKSLFSFDLIQKAGVVGIPHIYWLNKFQLNRWVYWLNQNPTVNLITINCQLYKPELFKKIQNGIKIIADKTQGRVHFILEGPEKQLLSGISEIKNLIHVATKMPTLWAIMNLSYPDKKFVQIDLPSLVQKNLLNYEAILQN